MNKITAKMKIIGKTTERRGLIFKNTAYIIAMEILDPVVTSSTTISRTIPFEKYCVLDIGDILSVTMYSQDQSKWFFSKDDAN